MSKRSIKIDQRLNSTLEANELITIENIRR